MVALTDDEKKIISLLKEKRALALPEITKELQGNKSSIFYQLQSLVKKGILLERKNSPKHIVFELANIKDLEKLIKQQEEELAMLLFKKNKNREQINLQYTTLNNPLPSFIYESLATYARDANGYKPQPKELVEKLAKKHAVLGEMIFLTAGADEAIYLFGLSYGRNVHIFTPTYISYAEIAEIGAHIICKNSLVKNEYQIQTSRIDKASLIFLANPNNPFGTTAKSKIIELIENNPKSIVVVDEVYAEFANLSIVSLTKKYKNLAVIRSFSKSYGMAGNRIGYVVAQKEILGQIRTKTQWANLSYLSAGAAITALEHTSYFVEIIQSVITRRKEFEDYLVSKGFQVLPTAINAALIKFKGEHEGSKFVEFLKENNVMVSHGNGESNIGLDKSFVRIAIGTEDEMEQVKQIISFYR